MTALRNRTGGVPRVAAAFGVVLVLGLTACTQSSDRGADTGTGASSSAESPPASTAPPTSSGEQEGTPIRITIGDQRLSATVWDNPTGQALLDQLPLTLDFEDLGGAEKIGHLDTELPMEGMPDGDDPEVGDLGYYAPWGNVVLYYGDVDYWDGIARIGRIHGDLSVISDQADDFTATLEAAR